MASVKHKKHNSIADWTQSQLDTIIAGGAAPLPPVGTTLAQVTLTTDWNDEHDLTGLQAKLTAGSNIAIDNTDPDNPIISSTSLPSFTANQVLYGNGSSTPITNSNLTFDGSLETITANSLGVTQNYAKGLLLTNTTAAANNSQQISPSLTLGGKGWGTSGGTSQSIRGSIDVLPIQGTVPKARMSLKYSIAGGAFANYVTFDNIIGSVFFNNMSVLGSISPSAGVFSSSYLNNSGVVLLNGFGYYYPDGVGGTLLADFNNKLYAANLLNFTSYPTGSTINGDLWYDGTHIQARLGGVTYQIDQQGGGGSPGGSDTQLQWNNSGAFDGLAGSVVSSNLLGLGITPTKRLHVKASSATLAPPTGLNVTPSLEVTPDNPTAVATAIDGPNDSSGASLAAPVQNDGAGSYLADGSTNITYNIYAYITVLGINYYTGTASTNSFTDNSDSSNFSVGLSWTPVTGATGYILQAGGSANNGNPNYTIDVGNVTSFSDDGAQSTTASIPTLFSTICFYPPITPVANDPTSASVTPNTGYGNYPDDGSISSIQYDIYAYDTSNPTRYYSNNPSTTTMYPPGMGFSFGPDLTWASGGSQNGFKIIITINYSAGGNSIGSYDAGNVTSLSNFVANSADLTITPSVSSFTSTTTRNYQASGYNTTPVTTYSPANYPYSVTDTAPPTGYVIVHTITYATTLNAKVLGSYDGQSLTASFSTTATSFLEGIANVFSGDATITPFHYGILASGQMISFREYSSATSPFTYYSSSYDGVSYTFPNDGNYYALALGWVNGGGTAVRFLRDTGSGFGEYYDTSGTSFNYYSYPSVWNSGSTVTPNSVEDTTATFESAAEHSTDEAQVILKSTGSTPYMRMDFKDNIDATKLSIGNDNSYNMKLFASGANFDFSVPTIGLTTRMGSSATTLNIPCSSNYYFQVNKGSSGTMFKVLSNGSARTRAFFGNDLTDTFGAAVVITPDSTSDEGLYINHRSGSGVVYRSGSGSTSIVMNAAGKIAMNRTIIGSGYLTIGPGDLSSPQIQFDTSSANNTATGGLWRATSGGGLLYNYVSTPCRLLTDSGTNLTTNFLPRQSSTAGMLADSGISDTGSIISFPSGESVIFGNGFAVSSGKNITTNGGSYTGGIRATLGSVSASTSLNIANHSPAVEFTGSTSGRTLTLPTAASIGGTIFEVFNRATVSVTIATTSSQNINIGTGTVTTLVLQPGDSVKFVATASSTWDALYYSQNIRLEANGGTGNSSYAVGDLLYASGATTLSKLADVATGNALISGGVTTAPSWGKIGLTTHVSGTLAFGNGGTGISTIGTANQIPTVNAGATALNYLYAINQSLQTVDKPTFAGAIFTAPSRLKGYTVATLPAGTQGDEAYVTDALAPTFLATIVGGGAVVTPVFYNGSNWVGS